MDTLTKTTIYLYGLGNKKLGVTGLSNAYYHFCCTEINPVTIISKGLIGWHCIITPFPTLHPNRFCSSKSRCIPKHLTGVRWQEMYFKKMVRKNRNGSGRGRWCWSATLHMVCLLCIDKLWEVWCIPMSQHG